MSELLHKSIKKLEDEYKTNNLKLEIAKDSTVYTLEAADSVLHDLMIAVVLVAFVMLFFLHSIRNSLIVMVSIPASLIATFYWNLSFRIYVELDEFIGTFPCGWYPRR